MSVSVGAKVPVIISTTTQTHTHMEWQVDGWVWCRLIVAGQTGILARVMQFLTHSFSMIFTRAGYGVRLPRDQLGQGTKFVNITSGKAWFPKIALSTKKRKRY